MIIRKANNNDKDKVLEFCKNTFSWGDYIHTVWDSWLNDPFGLLLTLETSDINKKLQPVAISHIMRCPNNFLWIEGIRVNQNYRKQGLASFLLKHMIDLGIKWGNVEANAIVSYNNVPSQKMFEKHGFSKLFDFVYYNINLKRELGETSLSNSIKEEIRLKVPNINDIYSISAFLKRSQIYKYCKRRYFNSWKFYILDNSYHFLSFLINNNKLLLFTNELNQIKALSLINIIEQKDNFYNKYTVQICYLDCIDYFDYSNVIDMLFYHYLKSSIYSYIQFYLPYSIEINDSIIKEKIKHFEKFFLYSKNLNNFGNR